MSQVQKGHTLQQESCFEDYKSSFELNSAWVEWGGVGGGGGPCDGPLPILPPSQQLFIGYQCRPCAYIGTFTLLSEAF